MLIENKYLTFIENQTDIVKKYIVIHIIIRKLKHYEIDFFFEWKQCFFL